MDDRDLAFLIASIVFLVALSLQGVLAKIPSIRNRHISSFLFAFQQCFTAGLLLALVSGFAIRWTAVKAVADTEDPWNWEYWLGFLSPVALVGTLLFYRFHVVAFHAVQKLGLAVAVPLWTGIAVATVVLAGVFGWDAFQRLLPAEGETRVHMAIHIHWPVLVLSLALLVAGLVGISISRYLAIVMPPRNDVPTEILRMGRAGRRDHPFSHDDSRANALMDTAQLGLGNALMESALPSPYPSHSPAKPTSALAISQPPTTLESSARLPEPSYSSYATAQTSSPDPSAPSQRSTTYFDATSDPEESHSPYSSSSMVEEERNSWNSSPLAPLPSVFLLQRDPKTVSLPPISQHSSMEGGSTSTDSVPENLPSRNRRYKEPRAFAMESAPPITQPKPRSPRRTFWYGIVASIGAGITLAAFLLHFVCYVLMRQPWVFLRFWPEPVMANPTTHMDELLPPARLGMVAIYLLNVGIGAMLCSLAVLVLVMLRIFLISYIWQGLKTSSWFQRYLLRQRVIPQTQLYRLIPPEREVIYVSDSLAPNPRLHFDRRNEEQRWQDDDVDPWGLVQQQASVPRRLFAWFRFGRHLRDTFLPGVGSGILTAVTLFLFVLLTVVMEPKFAQLHALDTETFPEWTRPWIVSLLAIGATVLGSLFWGAGVYGELCSSREKSNPRDRWRQDRGSEEERQPLLTNEIAVEISSIPSADTRRTMKRKPMFRLLSLYTLFLILEAIAMLGLLGWSWDWRELAS